jgi:predicted nucleic acid-binding protein
VRLPQVLTDAGVAVLDTVAGALRAKYRLPLPDMLQAACAIQHGAALITNDKALHAVTEIPIVSLDELR